MNSGERSTPQKVPYTTSLPPKSQRSSFIIMCMTLVVMSIKGVRSLYKNVFYRTKPKCFDTGLIQA